MTASEKNQTVFSVRDRQKNRLEEAITQDEQELTEWEEKFLSSCLSQIKNYDRELSEKQERVLETIEDVIKNGRKSR